MTRMRWLGFGATVAGACLLAACGSPATHARPEFVSGSPFRAVAILPPAVSIDRSRLSGGESLVAEALRIEDVVTRAVAAELDRRGYVVRPGLSVDALDRREDLRDAVADLQARHDDLLGVIARDPAGIRRGRFTLGVGVAGIGDAAGADLLLFVRASGELVATSQKVTEAVLGVLLGIGGLRQDTLSLLVTAVDARDGRVMAIVSGGATGNVVKDPERVVGQALAAVFRQFPARVAAGPARVSPPH